MVTLLPKMDEVSGFSTIHGLTWSNAVKLSALPFDILLNFSVACVCELVVSVVNFGMFEDVVGVDDGLLSTTRIDGAADGVLFGWSKGGSVD